MLQGLSRLVGRITADDVEEAEIYRRPDLYRHHRVIRPPKGHLLCPICGTAARRFLPFGLDGRRNAVCPDCGSLERHRFLWLYLTRATAIARSRSRVLHTAPEPCLEPRLRAVHGRGYVSVDAFNPHADRRAPLTALPFAEATFDVVLSSHVLEHVPDDHRAVAEIARVLRPGGVALMMFPFNPRSPTREDPNADTPAKRHAAFGHPYHYRVYGADVAERFADAGLAWRRVDSRGFLSPHHRRRHRINRNHLFVITKPVG